MASVVGWIKFKRLLQKFSTTNSGRALIYINRSASYWKLKWVSFWLLMLIFTVWSCALNIQTYLQYKTKVSMTYSDQKEIQFPSISFCNQFALSKSAVGSNVFAISIYTGMFAETMKELYSKFDESYKLCHSNSVSLPPPTSNTTLAYEEMGLLDLQKLGARDSFKSVVKCWWNDVEIETDGIFMNHFLDAGACFTFMPKKDEAYNYAHSDFSKVMYGLNETMVTDRILTNSGPRNGLRILLNVEQTDHCDTTRKYEGDGFQAVVHDYRLYKPTFSMLPVISLNPGYEISVILKPTNVVRKTADLGYCREPVYFRGTSKYYFKTDCITACFIKRTILECRCFPPLIVGLEKFFSDLLGFNISTYGDCGLDNIQCMKQQQFSTFKGENPSVTCHECLEPCYETRYDFSVTYNKFPKKTSYDYLRRLLRTSKSMSEMRKNYLMINFYFDSMTILNVVESQDYTIRGLFIFIGCKIGLFLGLSFMSWGEIFQLIIELIFILLEIFSFKNQKTGRNWKLRSTWKLITKVTKWKRSITRITKPKPRRSIILINRNIKRRSTVVHPIGIIFSASDSVKFQNSKLSAIIKPQSVIFDKHSSVMNRWKRITTSRVEPANVIFTKSSDIANRRQTMRDLYLNLSI